MGLKAGSASGAADILELLYKKNYVHLYISAPVITDNAVWR